MADVLINHPHYGSLWLSNCELVRGDDGRHYVIGDARDDSAVGSPYMPGDYNGQPVTMNFPVSCVRKDPSGLTPRCTGRAGSVPGMRRD